MPAAPSRIAMTPALWGELLLLGFIWGGSFFLGRIAMAHLPPVTTAFFRVAMAAAALWLLLAATRRAVIPKPDRIAALLLLGMLNNAIPFTLILWGQREIGSGLASIINAMTPIWTLLLAHWLTNDERIRPERLGGVLFGFAGVGLLLSASLAGGLSESFLPQAAVLLATVSYAAAAVFGRRFADTEPAGVAAGQLTASSAILLPVALVAEQPWQLPPPPAAAVLSVLSLAFVCTAFAYVLFFRILARAGATNVSLVTLLVPASAILLGAIFLGERLAPSQFAGMALILIGLILIDGRILPLTIRRGN